MSLINLGVFGLDKRTAAADEASRGNTAAYDTVTATWLGKGCGTQGVRALRLLNRATRSEGARAAPCRDLVFQRCHLEVCWNQPGGLVSDGQAMSGL